MPTSYILLNNSGGSADIGDKKSSADSPVKIHEFDVWKEFLVQKLKVSYKKYQQVTISNIQTLENVNISLTSIFVRTAKTSWFLVLPGTYNTPNYCKFNEDYAELCRFELSVLFEELQAFKHVSFISPHTLSGT